MRTTYLAVGVLLFAAALALPPPAVAVSGYYGAECAGCHGSSASTCNGCHMHKGTVTGQLNKTSFAPGETMTITVSAGGRTGWWRAAVLDQGNTETKSALVSGAGSTTLTVAAPATAGTYSWKAAWYGNARGSPSGTSWLLDAGNRNHGYQTVSLPFTVTAPAPAPAPVASLGASSLAFGNVTVGQSRALTTSVRNTGNASLSVTSVTACSNTAPPYAISPTAAFNVAASGNQTLTVTFAPASSGDAAGCFKLATSDAMNPTLTLNVTGTGTAAPAPSATLTPATLPFGDVTIGQAATLTATVGNNGNAALDVSGVTTCDSSSSAAFTVTPAAAFTVAAGGKQVLTVQFAPPAAGNLSACYRIATNDPARQTLQLTATGSGVEAAAPPPPPPPPECGSCHTLPPTSGKHTLHDAVASCETCHGSGYSRTSADPALHLNGAVEMSPETGWRASRRTCANACHGRKRWGRGGNVRGVNGENLYIGPEDVAEDGLAAGCSSAGGSLGGMALAVVALLGAARRRRERPEA